MNIFNELFGVGPEEIPEWYMRDQMNRAQQSLIASRESGYQDIGNLALHRRIEALEKRLAELESKV